MAEVAQPGDRACVAFLVNTGKNLVKGLNIVNYNGLNRAKMDRVKDHPKF